MNSKLALLLSALLVSSTALAQTDPVGGGTTRDTGAMDQGVNDGVGQDSMDPTVSGGTAEDPSVSGGTAEQGVTGTQQQEASFTQADSNADGLISEEEAQGSQHLADNFDQADANTDGYVNR